MTKPKSPEVSKQDGVTVVLLGSDYENLDEHTVDELTETLLEVADNADPPLVVLDLSHTQFFGSSFIEVLFRVWNRLNERDGGKFCISGLTSYCAEVIEITHLDRLWPIAVTREEAVNTLIRE